MLNKILIFATRTELKFLIHLWLPLLAVLGFCEACQQLANLLVHLHLKVRGLERRAVGGDPAVVRNVQDILL